MPNTSRTIKIAILTLCLLLLTLGIAITIYNSSSSKTAPTPTPTPTPTDNTNTQSDYQRVKTIVESVLTSQSPLPNGEKVPANSRLNSLVVNPDEIIFDFSQEIISGGQDTFSLIFSRIDNALQKDWRPDPSRIDTSLPSFIYRILIDGVPLEDKTFPSSPNAVTPQSQSE